MKIYLDDIRVPKGLDWVIVRTFDDCYDIMNNCWSFITEVSLDHDLGCEDTGYDIAKFMEEKAIETGYLPRWNVHSANPVGKSNIEAALKNAERHLIDN